VRDKNGKTLRRCDTKEEAQSWSRGIKGPTFIMKLVPVTPRSK